MCLYGLPWRIDSKGSIANCSLSSLSTRTANYDCYSGDVTQWLDYWALHLFHALVLPVDSIGELLTGCSRGQSVRNRLGN